MQKIKQSRALSFFVVAAVYAAAALIGLAVYNKLTAALLVRLFAADAAATVFVWFWGVLFRNASMYDPYWSVSPPVLLTGLALEYSFGTAGTLLLIAVWLWGLRLTGNWAHTFKNLSRQDWRYDDYQARFPRLWPLINFFGINLMPTFVVFLAMLPGILLITKDASANPFSFFAFALCLASVFLQLVSDTQLHRFRAAGTLQVCDTGLWRYSRHPNYLGEMGMWWGVYLMLLSAVPGLWITALGAALNTALFAFISIPMMEKRQLAHKPEYAAYRLHTPVLPLFPRK